MTFDAASPPSLRTSGALAGVAAGAALIACAYVPTIVVAAIFVVLAAAVAWGWPRLLNLPSPLGTSGVLSATALALALVMLGTPEGARTRWGGAVLSIGLIGSFLHQLLRQDGRPRLVMSLAGTALGLGILGSGAYVIAASDTDRARHLTFAAGVAVACCALLDLALAEQNKRAVKATTRHVSLGFLHVGVGAVVGIAAVVVGAGALQGCVCGAVTGLLGWSTLRAVVTATSSAHTRAQVAAGCACALVCGFVPFGIAQLW